MTLILIKITLLYGAHNQSVCCYHDERSHTLSKGPEERSLIELQGCEVELYLQFIYFTEEWQQNFF